jgi:heptosyltransferase II
VSLSLTAEDHRQAERWLERHAIAAGFVALAPGSIWGTKRWPYYADLVKRVARPCVVIGSAADCNLADSIVSAAPTRAVSAAGALGLRAAASLISRAAVLVTNDSAPLHLATAMGTPTWRPPWEHRWWHSSVRPFQRSALARGDWEI